MNRQGERWLVIGAYSPQDRSGSAHRIRQHRHNLREEGAEVRYWGVEVKPWAGRSLPGKLAQAPKILLGLMEEWDPNCSYLFSWRKGRELDETIREFGPTHVLVCESWLWPYVQTLRGGYGFWFRLVLDLHNVEAVLRRQSGQRLRGFLMEAAESSLMEMCDEVWVCSLRDAGFVRDLYRREAVVVPNKVRVEDYQDLEHSTDTTFGMVAIWSYEPNSQAAENLLTLWKELPESTVILPGKNPTGPMVRAFDEGALVPGEVEDVRLFLRMMRTCVVPLEKGGGTRIKILEAMAAGIPVVATPKAVEGIEGRHMEHFIICEVPEMRDWVRKLWDSPGLEAELSRNGRKLVREKYAW